MLAIKTIKTAFYMENQRLVSTEEVARILGVGVSTVKRWVDQEILPATRTCGGHRRIRFADVMRLARQGRLPDVDIARLPLLASAAEPHALGDLKRDLHRALVAGDETTVRALFVASHQAGLAVEALADEVIAPALCRVGHDWSEGKIDVMHEHRGVQACISALCEMKHRLMGRADRLGPVAVGGAPERDHYLLPCLLAELVLIDSGWQVVNLGPNTPMLSYQQALAEFRPRLLWLSVSHVEDRAEFLNGYRSLQDAASCQGAVLMAGGQALDPEMKAAMPCTLFGDGLRHLAAVARSLHPHPGPPRRGRPRNGDSHNAEPGSTS